MSQHDAVCPACALVGLVTENQAAYAKAAEQKRTPWGKLTIVTALGTAALYRAWFNHTLPYASQTLSHKNPTLIFMKSLDQTTIGAVALALSSLVSAFYALFRRAQACYLEGQRDACAHLCTEITSWS